NRHTRSCRAKSPTPPSSFVLQTKSICPSFFFGLTERAQVGSEGGPSSVLGCGFRFSLLCGFGEGKVNRILEVECYKDEQRGEDILLGKGIVSIEETLQTGEFDDVSINIQRSIRPSEFLNPEWARSKNKDRKLACISPRFTPATYRRDFISATLDCRHV
ncbi:hypothetical protein BDN67DRAFT_1026278, partial [Paxillus ammoniavirescens]